MTRRGPRYDTVYRWDGAAWLEVPRADWPAGAADAHEAARRVEVIFGGGCVAHPGSTSIGPPEGPPYCKACDHRKRCGLEGQCPACARDRARLRP